MFLRRAALLKDNIQSYEQYPFTIPVLKQFDFVEFNQPVTFFVGENGSGKSTLLEAIADKADFNTAGGSRDHTYDVHAAESGLGDHIRLSWAPKTGNGFFMRAESFYHFATHIDQLEREQPTGYSRYGIRSLLEQSHGESFLSLFLNRFNGNALYLLDEPEAALSPQRQLTFLRIMRELVENEGCQFIIATHSPILLGYPSAEIYNFDDGQIQQIEYEMTDHYQITKYFLDNRERFLKELFEEE